MLNDAQREVFAAATGANGQGGKSLRSLFRVCVGLICLSGLAGCDAGGAGDVGTSPAPTLGAQARVGSSQIEAGRQAYNTYCVGCHGENGDGKGEAAVFLHPKPRDFQRANFKFSSTRAGSLPTHDDLRRTITEGLKGTSMPGWEFLPPATVDALIQYIKTFSPRWTRKPGAPIPFVIDPYGDLPDKSTAIHRGEVVYHGYAYCWTCHPSYVSEARINEHLEAMENSRRTEFRPGLFESAGMPNSEGETIFPTDFKRDFVRAGTDTEDLYRSIAAGISGTAMPTWIDSMDFSSAKPSGGPLVRQADVWAMAYYVQSLIRQRPAKFTGSSPKIRNRVQRIFLHGAPPSDSTRSTEGGSATLEEEFEDD